MTPSIAVIILTFNEERHIARAIASVRAIAADIVVVDSFSTDATCELAENAGARVFQNKFVNYAKQFRWAMTKTGLTADWFLRLDADEYIESDLREAIVSRLPTLQPEITGVNFKRKHIFLGRWVRHGGRYPLILLRLWRRGKADIEDRWMDEHMILTEGRPTTFEGGFCDHNLNDISWFVDKHNRYATREAIDVILKERKFGQKSLTVSAGRVSAQAGVKRFVKETVYNRMPFFLSSTLYFLYRYVILFGFLDGREGAIYHFLQAYWYRFLVGAKILEFTRELTDEQDEVAFVAGLSRLTGYSVERATESG